MRPLVAVSILCSASACSGLPEKPANSALTQLTDRSYACHDFAAASLRASQAQTPQGFFRGFSADERQILDQRMADMPRCIAGSCMTNSKRAFLAAS
jgi:hypothetical protein